MTLKTLRFVTCTFLVAFALSTAAVGQSMSCRASTAAFGEDVCSVPGLRDLDEKLSLVLAKDAAREGSDTPAKEDQQKWTDEVRSKCQSRGCIGKAYEARLTELTKDSATPWSADSLDTAGYAKALIAKSNFFDTSYEFDTVSSERIIARLKKFESSRGNVAIAVIGTSSGEDINQFAQRLLSAWNSASGRGPLSTLIVIAIEDRAFSIRVSDLISEKLTKDALSSIVKAASENLRKDKANALISIVDDIDSKINEYEIASRGAEERAKADAIAAAARAKAEAENAEALKLKSPQEAQKRETVLVVAKVSSTILAVVILVLVGWKKRKPILRALAALTTSLPRPTRHNPVLLGVAGCMAVGAALAFASKYSQVSTIFHAPMLTQRLECTPGSIFVDTKKSESRYFVPVDGVSRVPQDHDGFTMDFRPDGTFTHVDVRKDASIIGSWITNGGSYEVQSRLGGAKLIYSDIKKIVLQTDPAGVYYSVRVRFENNTDYGGVPIYTCRGTGNLTIAREGTSFPLAKEQVTADPADPADPAESCRNQVRQRFADSGTNPMPMIQALQACGTSQGQRASAQMTSKEEKARAINEKVRAGGPYCDGIANYLERYLDEGRWDDYYETLGKAKERSCI